MREYGWVVGDHNNQGIILQAFESTSDTVYPENYGMRGQF